MSTILPQNNGDLAVNKKNPLLYPRKFFNRSFNIGEVDEIPYLIAMQVKSYEDFLQKDIPQSQRECKGIEAIFRDVFPVGNERATIEYVGYEMGEPKYDPNECQQRGVDYAVSLKLLLRMIIWSVDEEGNKEVDSIKEQVVYMGEVPLMTKSGTFIINGAQRVIVSQMHRSPGVSYLRDDGKSNSAGKYIYSARIIPYYGSWLDIECDHKDLMYFRIDKKKKLLLTTLLYALGLTRTEIFKTFYEVKKFVFKNGKWIGKFDILDFVGSRFEEDIVSSKNGDILLQKDARITPGLINRLKSKFGTDYYASENEIIGKYFAEDTVIIDSEGNKKKYLSGDEIDQEALEYIKNNSGKISILMIGGAKTGDYLRNTLLADKNTNRDDALVEIYRTLRPGEQYSLEVAEKSWHSIFFDPSKYNLSAIGRMKMNVRHDVNISEEIKTLQNEDIIAVIKNLISLRDGNGEVDDIDSLSNRRVRSVGELIENQFRIAFLRIKRYLLERMSSADETAMLHELMNSRVLWALIREFFGTSQLSQFVDQTNTLSTIAHSRIISALGPGGLDRTRAGFEERDVHYSHYNRICPIQTPEGQNTGLINSLAIYARINKYGFIETPYIKIEDGKITDKIDYLSAIEEQKHIICPSNIDRDQQGFIKDERVICRKNGDFISMPVKNITYMDLAPTQVVSVAASLIPFLEHNDANRALMGANMQRQAVPLMCAESPLVGTGTESVVARNSDSVVLSEENGIVESVDSSRIVVISLDDEKQPKVQVYALNKYQKSNHNTLVNQVPIVNVGDTVKKGDVIADGSCTKHGELALGKNLLVAFMPWNGYNFEDAIVISERMVIDDVLTSVHIQQYVLEVRDGRLGQEKLTPFIPNASEDLLNKLDESGIVRIGSEVKGGDYLVGKVTPKGESLLTPEEKLLQAIFGEKASEYKDASLRVPPGEGGTVIGVRIFTRRGIEKNERAILLERVEIDKYNREFEDKIGIVEDFIKQRAIEILVDHELIKIGKKIPKNKMFITREYILNEKASSILTFVIDDKDAMEKMEKLRHFYQDNIEIFEKELKVKIERLQSGDDLPQGALQVVKVYVATKLKIQPGDKMAGRHGNKGVISKIAPVEDMPFLEDGTPVDIILNPIGVPSRMNIGQILETHLGWVSANLGKKISKMLDSYYKDQEKKILEGLREELSRIYEEKNNAKNNSNNNEIHNRLANATEEELIKTAEKLRKGVPFATPIFSGATEEDISKLLEEAGCDKSGQVRLIDGRTGEYFDRAVTVGYIYMLKLDHLVYDKMHMRSIGPYSLVTQQPLGGRSHFGGQRFGEMECWALEAYGAAYTLHELCTVKSDDVVGRTKIYEKICNKEEGYISPSMQGPESFHVMVMELRSLCIDIQEVSIVDETNNSKNHGGITATVRTDSPEIEEVKISGRRNRNIIDPAESEQQSNDGIKSRQAIMISLASPKTIKDLWSHGEIKLPDTINYRTAKPEKGGMFCAAIFGPIKDYECLCGKYKRMKYRGVVCEKCGVEVTTAQKRRRRMAHITLAAPVVHIWFLRSLPSRIATLLDITLKNIERVLYFDAYMVSEPGFSHFQYGELISAEEYYAALDQYGEGTFSAGMGAEVIRKMLEEFNLEENRVILREELADCSSEIKRKKIVRRLKLIEDFIESGVRPEWMVLTVLPVIPPDLRPLVMLDGGRFATSDLNELYRRVINRNNRLKRLIELRAPEVIINNEKRMLQESVDALLDNSRKSKSLVLNKRPLKSLADMLKGKQGRFRQNLLGKRVDYSGRSVIIAGPHLKLSQCGLPKRMALELFKPFIYAKLEKRGIAVTIRAAKKMVEIGRPEVWDILEEVIKEHPVLLNRAPTLHRLGIQAFEPILIDGMAIQLHPLVCAAFNADFDGDQMAVHVPLSPEAQSEARILMASTKNILSPANGKPIIVPSQDMIQGLYYLTMELPEQKGEGMIFSSFSEVEYALFYDLVEISARIKCRYKVLDIDGKYIIKLVETTPGRLIFAEALPKNCKIRFDQVNKQMNKKEVSNLIEGVYRSSGQKDTVSFADNIMQLGFKYACKSGLSFGKDDMVIPPTKQKHVSDAKEEVLQYEMQYAEGLITSGERYNKVVDTWSRCTELIGADVLKYISLNKEAKPVRSISELNSIFMMADSGARGSAAQIRQLTGMRGLMTKPSGEIIEMPIVSNFREGLSVHEYFTSTHGTRKGLSDTALKTANSGYLTRKLVDVSQDCIVVSEDCKTEKFVVVNIVMENGEVVVPLRERVLGRVAATDIYYPIHNKLIVSAGEMIDENKVDMLEEAGIESIRVRSPIMCETKGGICAKCYGRDLSNGKMVKVGTAVGIIAAQSIGEPGTQLTMRTFHIGGAAQKSTAQSNVLSSYSGTLRLTHKNVVIDSKGNRIVMSRNCEAIIADETGCEIVRYKLPYGSTLFFNEYEQIKSGAKIAEWDPFTIPIITEKGGFVSLVDLIKDVSVKEISDEITGMTSYVVIESKGHKRSGGELRPAVMLKDKDGNILTLSNGMEAKYHLPVNAILSVKDKAEIGAGDIIARIPKESSKSRDITGGLPRVVELFEARRPKVHSLISEINGYVQFAKDYKSKRHLIIRSEEDAEKFVEYFIARGHNITVQEGDYVKKGDLLMEGTPSPHEILEIMGVEALANHIINEVQQVYRLQGVAINDLHIEVIIRQMLKKVEVTEPNGTIFLQGEQVDREEFDEINRKTIALGYKPAKCMQILQGITKSSLQTRSVLSAASFQETTRVITDAALGGKIDELRGLKENVIVGKLIPAGSGYSFMKLKDQALKRDKEIKDSLSKELVEMAAAAESNSTSDED